MSPGAVFDQIYEQSLYLIVTYAPQILWTTVSVAATLLVGVLFMLFRFLEGALVAAPPAVSGWYAYKAAGWKGVVWTGLMWILLIRLAASLAAS